MKKNLFRFGIVAIALSVIAACNEEEAVTESGEVKAIVGAAQAPQMVNGVKATRSVVVENNDAFELYWAAGEAIGVYGSSIKNTKYTSTNKSNAQSVTFSGGSLFKTPKYAYYPYSSLNSSNAQTAVKGSLAQVQSWNASAPTLAGDYKVGTYKSAVEPFIATEMSDANREQITAFLNSTWKRLLEDVSASRGMSEDDLKKCADDFMMFSQAETYIANGLADTLLYKDGVLDYLKTLTGCEADERLHTLSLNDMKNVKRNVPLDKSGNIIAVYYAFGEIDNATSTDSGINSTKVIKDLRKLREDETVKAVVLRVNSPGGSAFGSEQIWREVTLLKEEKPVIVSMGDYAASGGYYISCAANCIVADPTTLTGSIGIFGMFPNLENLLTDKLGLHFETVKTNRFADMGDMTRSFNDAEKAAMQNYINNGYKLFVQRCAEGRGMSVEAIEKIAEGRVWTGSMAKELGLVDELGGLDKALEIAAQKAGVENYSVLNYPEMDNVLSTLLNEEKKDYIESQMAETLGEYYDFAKFVRNIKNADRIQARLPFELQIR